MPGQRIVDVSSNNHPAGATIDWEAAARSGIVAAIIKATQATDYINPYYHGDATHQSDVHDARGAGLAVCAYHYAGMTDPVDEAHYFYAVAGLDAKVDDVEMSSNTAWMNAFAAALPFPPSQEMTYGSASTLPQSGVRMLLWPASYGRNYGFGDCWQFTSSAVVPGIPGSVDESVWLGPDDEFNVFFGLTPPTPGGGTVTLNSPTVAIAHTPSGKGYWEFAGDGGVFNYGDAGFYGSMGGKPLAKPIVAAAATPSGNGYWLVGADGGIFCFGDAPMMPADPLPGMPLAAPITAAAATPSGKGLWLIGGDGGVFCLGDAQFYGRAGLPS